MAGQPQHGVPAWLAGHQKQHSANDDGGGLEGVTPPAMKFKEGDSHFRLMPPAEGIPAALAAARAGQAADWSGGGFSPVCRMRVYFPSYGDGASKGISLFGSKAVVSPSTIFPNEGGPVYGNDPAAEWLEAKGIRYMKTDELKKDPMAAALREALSYKDRTVMQLVNLGLSQNGAPIYLQHGQGQVETYFVYSNDFDSKWTRPLFTEVIERGRQPFDPGWYGIHYGIYRKGTDRNTEYSNLRGLFGAPYGDASKNYGYAMCVDFQTGQPNWQEIERILSQVKPWKQIMHIATVEEVKEALDRTVAAIYEKFAPASVQVPAMPGGNYGPPMAGLPSSPAMPGGGPAVPPPPGQYPPQAQQPQYQPPSGPPQAPSAPPPPPGGPPQYPQQAPGGYQQPQYPPQQQQPGGYAPPAGPPQYPPQQAPGGPPQYGQPQYLGATVPATPPNTQPLSAPPQGMNPAGVNHAAHGVMPPTPPQPPQTPGGPPIPPPPPTR